MVTSRKCRKFTSSATSAWAGALTATGKQRLTFTTKELEKEISFTASTRSSTTTSSLENWIVLPLKKSVELNVRNVTINLYRQVGQADLHLNPARERSAQPWHSIIST